MGKSILLCDLLRLIPTKTRILIHDVHHTLFVGSQYNENIHKYEDKLVLELVPWDETTLNVRIINED